MGFKEQLKEQTIGMKKKHLQGGHMTDCKQALLSTHCSVCVRGSLCPGCACGGGDGGGGSCQKTPSRSLRC